MIEDEEAGELITEFPQTRVTPQFCGHHSISYAADTYCPRCLHEGRVVNRSDQTELVYV
ncbi:MAG: hypothetical protein WCO23_04125 [bacterium]